MCKFTKEIIHEKLNSVNIDKSEKIYYNKHNEYP